jgi:glycerol kinase
MLLDSKTELKHLKVDGGMTNGDVAMSILADIGGFNVVRPQMREWVSRKLIHWVLLILGLTRSTALGSALLAGSAIGLFGWDITKPETLAEVNVKGSYEFRPSLDEKERQKKWAGWKRAVERSKGWDEGIGVE